MRLDVRESNREHIKRSRAWSILIKSLIYLKIRSDVLHAVIRQLIPGYLMIFVICMHKLRTPKCVAMKRVDFPSMLKAVAARHVREMGFCVSPCIFCLMCMCLVKNVVENAIMKKLYKLPIKEKIFMMSWK